MKYGFFSSFLSVVHFCISQSKFSVWAFLALHLHFTWVLAAVLLFYLSLVLQFSLWPDSCVHKKKMVPRVFWSCSCHGIFKTCIETYQLTVVVDLQYLILKRDFLGLNWALWERLLYRGKPPAGWKDRKMWITGRDWTSNFSNVPQPCNQLSYYDFVDSYCLHCPEILDVSGQSTQWSRSALLFMRDALDIVPC